MKQESNFLNNEDELPTAISDDIEVIGPGRMLSEARENLGLSQQQVADKLNFRKTLVEEIEAEAFDLTLPAAFNRGYLKNYAKLVNISQDDVLNSYDQLGVAQRQCAEMQSFSKGTEKQAEHNMLMWITYLILVSLITATVVWWYQAPSAQPVIVQSDVNNPIVDINAQNSQSSQDTVNGIDSVNSEIAEHPLDNNKAADSPSANAQAINNPTDSELKTQVPNEALESIANVVDNTLANQQNSASGAESENVSQATEEPAPVELVFTFSGDCWVNIYDATGERVAWGVKKLGYVMRFSGQAPFNVTLGKPELVTIEYNNQAVDMTGIKAGNIAKFSLPLKP